MKIQESLLLVPRSRYHLNSAPRQNAKFNITIPQQIKTRSIPAYLESILHNVINNALKYGVNPEKPLINIDVQKMGDVLQIKIRDYGSGIDLNEYGDRLFDLGSRFSTESEGEGLGLFMSKRQIEVLGGKLELKSQPQKGTEVKIILNA